MVGLDWSWSWFMVTHPIVGFPEFGLAVFRVGFAKPCCCFLGGEKVVVR